LKEYWRRIDMQENPFGADNFSGNGQASFPDKTEYSLKRIQWEPAVDIYETDKEVVAIVEIPGVKKGDIRVSFIEGTLTIEGVKNKLEGLRGLSFFCVERSYGSFKRTFRIVSSVDKENIDAKLDNGILTVVLPKI